MRYLQFNATVTELGIISRHLLIKELIFWEENQVFQTLPYEFQFVSNFSKMDVSL